MAGKEVLGLPDEESFKKLRENHAEEVVQVIFTNTFSYHLKFLLGHRIPTRKEFRAHTGNFPATQGHCSVFHLWYKPYVGIDVSTVNLKTLPAT